jgi:hypothetical protein
VAIKKQQVPVFSIFLDAPDKARLPLDFHSTSFIFVSVHPLSDIIDISLSSCDIYPADGETKQKASHRQGYALLAVRMVARTQEGVYPAS